jgi:hypothetical protein
MTLCTEPRGPEEPCNPNEESGEAQYLLGIAVPKGSSAPSTITAAPNGGGQAITFTRSDQVVAEISAATATFHAAEPTVYNAWPPDGLEGIGYLSGAVSEVAGVQTEWTIDSEFGLPTASDGGPFLGPFEAATAYGLRIVDPEKPASRPVHCYKIESSPPQAPSESDAACASTGEEVKVGSSNLEIAPSLSSPVYVGGTATLPFSLNFASTAGTLPTFNVGATTNLPGATASVSAPSFTPAAPDATTHRSSGSENVTVVVPKTATPGVYEARITATTPQGGTATQVAKFEVTKPKLKLGKVKLNKKNGTAKLSIGVPSAGTLTVSGKGIAKVQRKPVGPKTLKITIKAKGKAKTKLASTGKAKVKVKVVFAPSNGASVAKTKSIVLKKKLAG